ncbi:hypothetical protein HanIR_Chr15g0731571 [Helianthus annuus]|nr:hypothetical protein HanIR_Chr15g0731571 [Helianthus annuus]
MGIIGHPCCIIRVRLRSSWSIFVRGGRLVNHSRWTRNSPVNIAYQVVCNKKRMYHCFPETIVCGSQGKRELMRVVRVLLVCGEGSKHGHCEPEKVIGKKKERTAAG